MGKKKSKKKLFIVLGIILICIIVIFAFFSSQGTKAISVQVSKVQKRTITQTVSAIGKIQPETEVKISSETSGEIIFLSVKEGDTVKAGQMLIRIKPDIIESQLQQVLAAAEATKQDIDARKSELARTKAELQRMKELYDKKFASQEEYDKLVSAYSQADAAYKASMSRYDQAMASYRQVKSSAERTIIYSPINGVITKLAVEQGEKVVGVAQMTGTELMTVSDLNVMNAEVEVDENDITMIHIGDTTRIEIDALPEMVYKGVVVEIGHSALLNQLGTQDQVTNFKVKIRLLDKEARLRPGMSCNVEIETETRHNILSVPLQAVTVRDTVLGMRAMENKQDDMKVNKEEEKENRDKKKKPQTVVFVKKGDISKMMPVKTGISDDGYIEIIEGLKENQEIISGNFLAVSKQLSDGTKIRVDTLLKKKKKASSK
ncbi:MAG: efflux RND transporter periplasmic adaptor subunit [Ignavibacteriae bacterium]|nr:efflux RND transporter periplasmic adaptor subunit [Ignavibacteriota bacterium]